MPHDGLIRDGDEADLLALRHRQQGDLVGPHHAQAADELQHEGKDLRVLVLVESWEARLQGVDKRAEGDHLGRVARQMVAENLDVRGAQHRRLVHDLPRKAGVQVGLVGLRLDEEGRARGHPPPEEVVGVETVRFPLEVIGVDHEAVVTVGVVGAHLR